MKIMGSYSISRKLKDFLYILPEWCFRASSLCFRNGGLHEGSGLGVARLYDPCGGVNSSENGQFYFTAVADGVGVIYLLIVS